MAASDIVINERVDIEVRTDAASDLVIQRTVDLTVAPAVTVGRSGGLVDGSTGGLSAVAGSELDDDDDDGLDDAGEGPVDLVLIESDGLPPELAWQERALCAQTDPEAFFPEKGGSTREAKRV